MTQLSLTAVAKTFGKVQVLRGVDLQVPGGELTAVLGPSGCGKTTLLRLVAGFETPDAGTITIGDRVVCEGHRGLAPERRHVGYVAQEGALFPHLTVAGNITFGLPRSARRARARVAELLELVGMEPDHARRYPHQLSGGQQQRVALARALAPRPSLVLLDEPFSALDAGLRAETRRTVVDALAASGTTAVLVTHDQSEALSVAHRVAIMRDGRLVQTAAPAELYTTPADAGVAGFVGEAVMLPGAVTDRFADCALGRVQVRRSGPTGQANLMIRPEQIVIHSSGAGVPARVEECTYYGHDATVTLRLAGSGTMVSSRCAGHALPRPGDEVTLTVDGDALVYPAAP
ncbi:MAG: ABC transporter ATP-binding protein [Pseudonocardiaceae bacterium]